MTVLLDSESEVLIQAKVASGRYRDASEVVREALRALDERERLDTLRAKVAAGFAQADRGELIDYTPELRDELIRSALRRAQAGDKPSPDVCP